MHQLRIALFLSFIVFGFLEIRAAKADLILEGFDSIDWVHNGQPSASLSGLLFRVRSNDAIPNANQLNAFSVGLRVVATPGSVGTVNVQSFSVPTSNSVFTFAGPLVSTVVGDAITITGDNAEFANVSIPATGRSLFTVSFNTTNAATEGNFQVFIDRELTSYFTTTQFDGLRFANIPATGDANGVLLGTIRTSVTAVPEPSSVLLMIIVITIAVGIHGFKKAKSALRAAE